MEYVLLYCASVNELIIIVAWDDVTTLWLDADFWHCVQAALEQLESMCKDR